MSTGLPTSDGQAWAGYVLTCSLAEYQHPFLSDQPGVAVIQASMSATVGAQDKQDHFPESWKIALELMVAEAQPHAPAGAKQMQVRSLARGAETVLGDAAADDELFLTSQLMTRWAALPVCQMASSL